MKELEIKTADCSSDILIKTARKCGFVVVQSKKHCKIRTINGQFVTTIPRHTRLKRELIKGILDIFNQFGMVKIIPK